ncbi:MAG TPA: tetratricopeptide repeat protein [Methylomirabilota bacterium]|nr:tetratricopeptide repeat protein [Methylomirabilota bacterium]
MEQDKLIQQIEERTLTEKDVSKKFLFLQEIGNAYSKAENNSKALDYYEQALRVARKAHNRKLECNALINIGSSFFNLGKIDDAISTYKNALSIGMELQDYRVQSIVLGKLADAYLVLGENNQAIDYFHQGAVAGKKEKVDRSNVEYGGTIEDLTSLKALQELLQLQEKTTQARFSYARSTVVITIIMVILALSITTAGIILQFIEKAETVASVLSITIGILTFLVGFFPAAETITSKLKARRQKKTPGYNQ